VCLIVLAYKHHPRYRLIVAANRDEFYARPTSRAHFWDDQPDLLAGRDLKYGGTWMGLTRSGRFAAVTNFRDAAQLGKQPLSRGLMVKDFLTGSASAGEFIEGITAVGDQYNGFNLLVGDGESLAYHSNRGSGENSLQPGIYGLSNHLLDTPWPKVLRAKKALQRLVEEPGAVHLDSLAVILTDQTRAEDSELPDTGFGRDWERALSSPFIITPTYGTRASTVLLLSADGRVRFRERSFRSPEDPGKVVSYDFTIPPP